MPEVTEAVNWECQWEVRGISLKNIFLPKRKFISEALKITYCLYKRNIIDSQAWIIIYKILSSKLFFASSYLCNAGQIT